RRNWSLSLLQKVGVSLRSAKRFCRLVLLPTTRKALNTLVDSSRFVTLHCGIVEPTGPLQKYSHYSALRFDKRSFPISCNAWSPSRSRKRSSVAPGDRSTK